MDFDNNAVCEKIINDINAVFNKDRELSGFEIIPMVSNQNKSPVVHVEHNLGLESWCIKHVYEFSHRKILDSKIGNPKYLHSDYLLKYLNCAILINPDVTTFWNTRRKLIENNKLNITKEFQFTSIVLHRKPKSNEAFSYRRWLFLFQSEESIDWSFELRLCERCADKNPSNYHAWTHRQWVIQKTPHLLSYEIFFTEKFIRKHVSDYSAFHHRQFLLKTLLDNYFYEDGEYEYTHIKELIELLLSVKVDSNTELMKILLPDINQNDIHDTIKKSFLFCINFAAYDLKLCDELTDLFKNREAFQNHRRLMLKFIVDNCRILNTSVEMFTKHLQPLTKVLKYENNAYKFLDSIQQNGSRLLGENVSKKWCQTFLGFAE